jgi:hypothetical protein
MLLPNLISAAWFIVAGVIALPGTKESLAACNT